MAYNVSILQTKLITGCVACFIYAMTFLIILNLTSFVFVYLLRSNNLHIISFVDKYYFKGEIRI